MLIRDILRDKGTDVVTIDPARTVLEAMRELVRHGIGAVVVTREDAVMGILTERDVLRLSAEDPGQAADLPVVRAMTSELVVGVPEDSVEYVMEIMTKNRIRHLPVIEGGRLAGILSIGDVVNAIRSKVEAENRYLRGYIQGA